MTNIFYAHSVKNNIKDYGPDLGDAIQVNYFKNFIKEQGPENFLSIDQALNKNMPNNKIVLTFDDGFKDFVTNVTPIIKRYNIPVTLFVTTSTLDGQRRWEYWIEEVIANTTTETFQDIDKNQYPIQSNEKKNYLYQRILYNLNQLKINDRKPYIERLMRINKIVLPKQTENFLSWNDLLLLKKNQLVTIGSHCVHHNKLSSANIKTAINEMKLSKLQLEQKLNIPIKYISYPYGDINFFSNILINNIGFKNGFVTQMRKKYYLYPFKKWLFPRIDLKTLN